MEPFLKPFFVLLLCWILSITPTAAFPQISHFPSWISPRLIVPRADPPRADARGICYSYPVQATDTCQSIAQAHQITAADIEKYSAGVWGWKGCDHMKQGDLICLSAGDPVMPVALPHATCGPQVPGTARPLNYAILSSLNPCASGQCCTTEGLCAASSDICMADTCISNCGTKTIAQAPAQTVAAPVAPETNQVAPKSTTTKATTIKVEPITTVNADPTTTKANPQTTSTTKSTSTKSTSTTSKTTTSEGASWTLSAYTGLYCDGDKYLVFTGHKDFDGKCLDIHGGYPSDISTSGASCRYFWDGGGNSSDCDSSPSLGIFSWALTGGKCTAYNKQCNNSGRDRVKISPKTGCQADLERRPHYYMHWGSVSCNVS